ncbi:MAG TPA: hypothetical protein VJT67_14275 [Longimicrobiaceae bacterium]|nr:hypothetical protein [Longimicrobiaceae bacterium]
MLGSIVHFLFDQPDLGLRILGWLVAGIAALVAGGCVFYHVRLWWALRTRGWTVEHSGRDRIVYRERVRDRLEDCQLDGEMLMGTPHHVIYVPSQAGWEYTAPAWARGRREEIVARIRSRLREPGYEYAFG